MKTWECEVEVAFLKHRHNSPRHAIDPTVAPLVSGIRPLKKKVGDRPFSFSKLGEG
jgi:hypothetical protein